MAKRPRQPDVKITLRLPADLHRQLVEAAEDASPRHSLNAEIVGCLFDAFGARDQYEARLKELTDRIAKLEKGE